jgi:hypothetical protein
MLLASAREALGGRFVGMALFGSLSSGDFDPRTSDIDVLVITDGPLPRETIEALRAMHTRIDTSPTGQAFRLDACYIPRADLRRFEPDAGPYPEWGEEGFRLFHPGGDWIIQRRILRERGVVVTGPPLRDMIDPVSPDDLRWGVADVLQGWWAGQAENPDWLRERTVLQVFAVQTMCRALYTLRLGDIVSKPAAIRWGMAALDPPWSALAAQASTWQEGMPFAALAETLAMVRYTVERSRAFKPIHDKPIYTVGGAVDLE